MKRRLTVAGVALTAAMSASAATDRLVDYVSPSMLHSTNTCPALLPAEMTNVCTVVGARHSVTSSERWEKFQAEYGIKQRSDSVVLDSMQTAKYRLDQTAFELQETLNNIEESLSFDCGLSDLGLPVSPPKPYRTASGNDLVNSLQSARFQSDFRLKVVGETFVGVKLVLPFGN